MDDPVLYEDTGIAVWGVDAFNGRGGMRNRV